MAGENKDYLICEQKPVFYLLIAGAGMMGAYTFNLRGGVFCNAQTANFVMMAIAFGKGQWAHGFYFLIPVTAYFLGAVISEILPSPIKEKHHFRWDTWLVAIEFAILFAIGFMPLSWPHQIVQVIINFIASMQYNTFRQAEGIPAATTFCTNHLRQVGIAFAKVVRKHDMAAYERGMLHLKMLVSFFLGGVILTVGCTYFAEKAIWISLIPYGIILFKLMQADRRADADEFERKPAGH